MFIDTSYFVGENNVPMTDRQEVMSMLQATINRLEPEFLTETLSLTLYKSMKYGVSEERFIRLLYGAEFVMNEVTNVKWGGLLTPPDISHTVTTSEALSSILSVPNTMTYQDVMIYRLNTLLPSDRTSDTTVYIVPGILENDVIEFRVRPRFSIIASYVFFYWLRRRNTQTVGLGEVQTRSEASKLVSPIAKQRDVWNGMIDQLHIMYAYLKANINLYPEISDRNIYTFVRPYWCTGTKDDLYEKYQKINAFNI